MGRWNNLGSVGGEYILQTLVGDDNEYNHTLTECLLSGNQIPVQILRSIDSELTKNKNKNIQNDTISELEIERDSIIEIKPSDETIEVLQEEINDLFVNNTSLKEENERMKIKIAELEALNLDLSDKYDIAQNDKIKTEKESESMDIKYNAEREELENKVKELQIKIDEMYKGRNSDKLEFDNIRESIENDNNIRMNKLRETKDSELNKLRQNVNELHIELNEVKTRNNTLRSEILENEILSEKKCIEFEKNLRNECNKTLSEKINGLEGNITSIKTSRNELEQEMNAEKQKYSELIEQLETEKNQYQKWLNDEQKNKAKLENEQRRKEMEIQKYSNIITQKNQQIESLKIGIKETQKSLKTLENEHNVSMKRVLAQHNRQILTLEKSLRESEQRLTISEHRKRNLELRIIKIEDEEQRKIAAVHDAVKCLTNSFIISTPYNYINDVAEHKENDHDHIDIKQKLKKQVVDDEDDDETIIEIIDDDQDHEDYMRDHNTFNQRKKKKKKKKKSKASKQNIKE